VADSFGLVLFSFYKIRAVQRTALILFITAISDQTNHNKFFESVAKQHFQKIYWFGFERKAL
jgi:hypothetical protein